MSENFVRLFNVTVNLFISLVNTLKATLRQLVNAGPCETRLYALQCFSSGISLVSYRGGMRSVQDSICGICGEQMDIARGVFLSTLFC